MNSRTVMGVVHEESVPVRDPVIKWYLTKEEYSEDKLPTFCLGGGYILTRDLVVPLYLLSFRTRFLWLDDVYVTGLLAKSLNVEYININKRSMNFWGSKGKKADMALFINLPENNTLNRSYGLWKTVLKNEENAKINEIVVMAFFVAIFVILAVHVLSALLKCYCDLKCEE